MPKEGTQTATADQKDITLTDDNPRSLAIAQSGVKTGADFANLMSALMSDIIAGRVSPIVGNATCKAGDKLLKIVEMQMKYGKKPGQEDDKVLTLAQ
jgi:hypothetical protein